MPVSHHQLSRQRLQGIARMLAAVFVFAIMDASLKRLSSDYSIYQVSCLRCLSSLMFLMIPIVLRGAYAELRMQSPWLHVTRAILGFGMLMCFIFAVHRLTLAETYAVTLCAPLLMTALSVPIQKEHVPLRRWIAIGVGLAGVLVILRPSSRGFQSMAAVLAAAGAALCYALLALTLRKMSRTNTATGMVFWFFVLVGTSTGLISLTDWRPILQNDWGWLALVGVSGALGQYWLTDAFGRAPVSVIGPFEYTSILWAFAIDWIFWSAKPTAALVVGATIVVGSGIYIILDEHRLAQLDMNPGSPPP